MAARTVPRRCAGVEVGADHDFVFGDALRFGGGQLEFGGLRARGAGQPQAQATQRSIACTVP